MGALVTEYNITEMSEKTALKRLTEKISNHVVGRTIQEMNVTLVNSILDEEISNVNVAGTLACRLTPVFVHFDGALVVLI